MPAEQIELIMFFQMERPLQVNPEDLDLKLSKGWFRSQDLLYESHITYSDEKYWNSIKIRICLNEWEPQQCNAWQKIKKKNKIFTTEIKKAALTSEHYRLFDQYRLERFEDEYGNLKEVLGGDLEREEPCFPSWMVNVWKEDQLIGSGIFDLGKNSALGYLFYYDTEHAKYSLGKHLIYSMMQFCKGIGILYFYPGYYLPGMKSMEYKLGLAPNQLEYLELRNYTWNKWSNFSEKSFYLEKMYEKLQEISIIREEEGYRCLIVYDEQYPYYPFFAKCNSGWDAPFCLMCYHPEKEVKLTAIGYDVRTDEYCNFKFNENGGPQFLETDDAIYALYTSPMIRMNT